MFNYRLQITPSKFSEIHITSKEHYLTNVMSRPMTLYLHCHVHVVSTL